MRCLWLPLQWVVSEYVIALDKIVLLTYSTGDKECQMIHITL